MAYLFLQVKELEWEKDIFYEMSLDESICRFNCKRLGDSDHIGC
jgi:hypothetical protein